MVKWIGDIYVWLLNRNVNDDVHMGLVSECSKWLLMWYVEWDVLIYD